LATRELYDFTDTTVNDLKPKEKEIIRLRYYSGMSTRQIAQELKVSRTTIETRLARATEKLKRNISRKFGEDIN